MNYFPLHTKECVKIEWMLFLITAFKKIKDSPQKTLFFFKVQDDFRQD